MKPYSLGSLSIVPLFGWYDYSFAKPSDELKKIWTDFTACKWPDGFLESEITEYFLSFNESVINTQNQFIISFSHFLPRIDLMPFFIPLERRILYPILGTFRLEQQIRRLGSQIHIYGHTHVNNRINKNNTVYINNAFGYPHETRIARKELLCVYELRA
jgi:Icc-related predicted phosphoesterase